MGSCWAKYACDYAESMIGKPCGGKGDYSDIVAQMDAVSFYNYPKNGEVNSCKIFVDNCILRACTDPSYEEDPEGAKWTALYMVNEPQAAGANDGAGCAQSVRMYQDMGEWASALEYMDKAIELDPKDDNYLLYKADIYYEAGQIETAISVVDEYVERTPDYFAGYYTRGWYKYNLKDIDGAIEDYTTAITLDPDYPYAIMSRGNMYLLRYS